MTSYEIFVIGVGATGSNLIGNLAQYAKGQPSIKRIVLMDGDSVEEKNYRNQKFTKNDIAKNKALVLSSRYSKLINNISYIDSYLVEEDFLIEEFTKEVTPIVISCVDKNSARRTLNNIFYNEKVENIIYIDAGNGSGDDRNGQMIVGAKSNGKVISNPCSFYFPSILDPEMDDDEDFSCTDFINKNTQCLAVNVLSATSIFMTLVNIISYEELNGSFFKFNAQTIDITCVN